MLKVNQKIFTAKYEVDVVDLKRRGYFDFWQNKDGVRKSMTRQPMPNQNHGSFLSSSIKTKSLYAPFVSSGHTRVNLYCRIQS